MYLFEFYKFTPCVYIENSEGMHSSHYGLSDKLFIKVK